MRNHSKVIEGKYVHAREEDWPHLTRISHKDIWESLPPEVQERVGYRDFAVIVEIEYALSLEYHVLSKAYARLKDFGKEMDEWVTENLARDLTAKFDENNSRTETALDRLAVADKIKNNSEAQNLLQKLRELLHGEKGEDSPTDAG